MTDLFKSRKRHLSPVGDRTPPVAPPAGESRLPVYRKGKVVAWTQVDNEDRERLAAKRLTLHSRGYVNWGKGTQLLHREIMGLKPGGGRAVAVDHINGDKLDNRKTNLRIVTQQQNQQNLTPRQGATSRYRGVFWDKWQSRWIAQVRSGGKTTRLGSFKNEGEAALVALFGRLELLPYSEPVLSFIPNGQPAVLHLLDQAAQAHEQGDTAGTRCHLAHAAAMAWLADEDIAEWEIYFALKRLAPEWEPPEAA